MVPDIVIEDAVARAAAVVPRPHYTDHPELGSVPQVTAQFAIERDLRRADIQPGMRVLEIGTGTGYTGAVLAELVGPDGHVVSVDIDPALIQRAAKLHAERRVGNLTLASADGHHGAPEHAPFDAILGWATPTHIPQAWTEQARPGAVIATPISIAPVARTVGHIRVTVTSDGQLAHPRLGGAVYVDMGPEINPNLGVPIFYVDARHDAEDGEVAWISTAWRSDGHDPAATLDILQNPAHSELVPLGDTEEDRALAWRDFRSYCAGRDTSHHRPSRLRTCVETPKDGAAESPTKAHQDVSPLQTQRRPETCVETPKDGAAESPTKAHQDVSPLQTQERPAESARGTHSGPVSTHALTAYGTAGSTWMSGIGFSNGQNAAVLTSDGSFIAGRPDSPSLMKLRAFFRDWEQRGRPGIEALIPVLEPTSDGWQVRVTLARAAG